MKEDRFDKRLSGFEQAGPGGEEASGREPGRDGAFSLSQEGVVRDPLPSGKRAIRKRDILRKLARFLSPSI